MKNIVLLSLFVIGVYADAAGDDSTRYYGGYSENEVNIIKSKIHTAPLVVTEEVFNAKTAEDIDRVVEKKQADDIAKGISAKEFLQERTGHLYGGYSENKINHPVK